MKNLYKRAACHRYFTKPSLLAKEVNGKA